MTLGRVGPCQISMKNLSVKIFNDFRSFTVNATFELTIY